MQLVILVQHTQIGKRELSLCPNVANVIIFESVCYACFLPVCWATSTSKMDGVFQRVLQLCAKTPVCSNGNPVHLCYSHSSALHSSGGSVALHLRLASESHLQPQFRTPAGQMLLRCCCKQLCHVIKALISGASSVSRPASKCRLSLFLFFSESKNYSLDISLPRMWQSPFNFSPFPIFPIWLHTHLFITAALLNFPRISPWAIRTTSGGHSDH